MSQPPLVSVIIPTYNYADFIVQSLQSIQAQTYENWECIVVDDGSTDNTADVVSGFVKSDPRIKSIQQTNQLQGAAKNTGLKNSSGHYVQFLDADDLIEKRKLERQVEYLENHAEVDIVYGDVRFFRNENPEERFYTLWGENKPWQPGISGAGQAVLLPLLRLNTVPINTPLVRRDLLERVGFFDSSLPALEDWDYWLRCAVAGARFQFEPLEDTLALVRWHAVSWSKNDLRNVAAEVAMRKKTGALLSDKVARRVNAELLAEAEGTLGSQQVLQGRRAKGAYQLAKAFVLDRNFKHKLKWLSCALVAPFVTKERFRKIYSRSITQSVIGPLRQLQLSGRR